MNEMLRRNPPPQRDATLLALFREIGLHPEQIFDWDTLPAPVQTGLARAAAKGLAIVEARMTDFAELRNGWVEAIIDADMSGAPIDHAAMARLGLLYSQKEVSSYHVAAVDGQGAALNGANTYEIHFSPVPPVDAFWSVTMYDGTTKLLVDNPIDRYSVGDRTEGLVYSSAAASDITITVSNSEPEDATARANWLPAPKGPFYLVLREYSPAPAILTRAWLPPPVERLE
jgi:hypothetical protein